MEGGGGNLGQLRGGWGARGLGGNTCLLTGIPLTRRTDVGLLGQGKVGSGDTAPHTDVEAARVAWAPRADGQWGLIPTYLCSALRIVTVCVCVCVSYWPIQRAALFELVYPKGLTCF